MHPYIISIASLLLMLLSSKIQGQQFRILESKHVEYSDNYIIGSDSLIDIKHTVTISKKGELTLSSIEKGFHLYLGNGTYNLDSCYKKNERKIKHLDRVNKEIKHSFSNGLNYQEPQSTSMTTHLRDTPEQLIKHFLRHRDHIFLTNSIDNGPSKAVNSDTCTFTIHDTKETYQEPYFLHMTDFFGQSLEFKKIESNTFFIDINDYSFLEDDDLKTLEFGILIIIYTQDLRNSYQFQMTSKN